MSGAVIGGNAPLGVRNNNPLNIRISSNAWQGKTQSSNAFEKFISMDYGIRAGVKNLQTYYNRDKLTTIERIISKWAPISENNTDAYINRVASTMGVSRISILSYNANTFTNLVYAMAIVELGAVYITRDQILNTIKKFSLF